MREGPDLVTIQGQLRHCLGPPVDGDERVHVESHAESRDSSSLQVVRGDVATELQLGVQDLDPAVAGVHHVDVALPVQGEAAGLYKACLSRAVAAEREDRRVVTGHVEHERTVLDGSAEDEDLREG